jgi:hypothetical protein
MLDSVRHALSEQVFTAARRQAPLEALWTACEAVTGRTGNLVIDEYVVHAEAAALIDPAHPEVSVPVVECLEETALAPFDLVLSRVESRGAQPRSQALTSAIVALRLGLLSKMLNTAFLHLEGRESFGQKLTHQPLIKGQFSESGALLTRIRAELCAEVDVAVQAEPLHAEIDRHTIKAGKLMGGHGFRRGSLNDLEYLSSLLRATMAPAPRCGV